MKKTETHKAGRPEACTVDPETRQVTYHTTPPCPVDY